jgi:ubiquitin C-terminal hydrolase
MNATLQCLLHTSELVVYFLYEYPKDCQMLKIKNQTAQTRGKVSEAFNELVIGVYDRNEVNNKLNSINNKTYPQQKYFSPQHFKDVIGHFNPQFEGFSANDSKDLILYLLQTMHEELNYFGDNQNSNFRRPNQFDRVQTFMFFMTTYNMKNFSIISNIFYGTYEIVTQCDKCKNVIYNFQRFEFISFGMFDYRKKEFNIYNGFEDNQKPNLLRGDNQFYCNYCKSLQDATTTSNIIQPPNKLIINIDYGKNKKFKPSRIKFGEEIDITNFVKFDFGTKIKYRIIGVCTHKGESGISGHYIAYCKHRLTNKWYKFNDSECEKASHHDIYKDSPYLLLYERI